MNIAKIIAWVLSRKIALILLLYAGTASAVCDGGHLTLKLGDVVVKAEVAATEAQRERGLMGRRSLPKNTGMWFVFWGPTITTFWMKDTLIPLDLIFVGRDMRIVHIHENAHPMDETPIGSPTAFWYVLEVPAEFARLHHLRGGDPISILTPKC